MGLIAKLMEKNGVFYCSECRMRQFEPSYNCKFCGNLFSNFEDMRIEQFEEERKDKNEESLHRDN